jgi:Flp pilus assembly protein TadG
VRIQLSRRRRDERGAVALFTGLVAVLLLVSAAFTVDLGQAYNSKRQLQTAADSGSLAAALTYKGSSVACSSLILDTGLKATAQQAADTWAAKNYPGVTGGPISLSCSASGALTVTYSTTGSTPQTFGGLVTGHSTITTGRTASATIGNNTPVGNMRPWGICSGAAKNTGVVAFVPTYNSSTTVQSSATLCGTDNPPGGWWIGQCDGQSNGSGGTQDAVQYGCDPSMSYTSVPNQSTHNGSPTALYNWMVQQCPAKTTGVPYCLTSDTGKNPETQTQTQWQGLVGQTFQLPVYCDTPDCSQMAETGSGNGGTYAIEMMATVQLCGFKMTSPSTGWPTTGPCVNNNPNNYTSSSVTSGFGLFVVITALTGGPSNLNYQMPSYTGVALTQ